jgi:beta-phosphoglucomutase
VPLRAVVFDFDGVIVNSEPLHFRALQEALAGFGLAISEEEYWSIYLAYDDREAIRLAFERHGEGAIPDRLAAATERKVEAFARLVPEVPVFPGAESLVRGLAAADVPLAIASGARHDEIEAILAGIGLRDAFRAIVGAEDAPRTKPDPAPYVEAARRLAAHAPGLAPADCAAIEDSVPGILSACGAGMRVVGVAHSYPREKLAPAHRVVGSLVGLGPSDLAALFPS